MLNGHSGDKVSPAMSMGPCSWQATAKLADKRAVSTEVKSLAAGIQAAQDPEIMKMEGWLKDWNKPVVSGEMPGMDMGSGSMPGMMSAAEMKSLQAGAGTEFDMIFLTMMIKHHEGAITMAASEIAAGKNADAIALAKTIVSAQKGEIVTIHDEESTQKVRTHLRGSAQRRAREGPLCAGVTPLLQLQRPVVSTNHE